MIFKKIPKRLFTYMLLAYGITISQPVSAVAYCALRDPVEAIQFLYPQGDGHRSIVRAINNQARQEILNSLSFSLHFNELGKHTLYVILKRTNPIGLVHVRSELASWGLMEIAWALSPELKVNNFMFQRCRSGICSAETIENMLSLLAGKSIADLRALLSQDGESLAEDVDNQFARANEKFAVGLIRSALKTLAVTTVTWREEIEEIQRKHLLMNAFGDRELNLTRKAIGQDALDSLQKLNNGGGSMLQTASVEAFKINSQDETLGFLASGAWHDHESTRHTYWVFDKVGKVMTVTTMPRFNLHADANSFAALIGRNLSASENCSTASELMGHDIYFLASFGAR